MNKKIILTFIFCLLFVFFLTGSVHATNILFVGNSKTYYNDFPEIFKKLANSADSDNNVYVDSVTERWKNFEIS